MVAIATGEDDDALDEVDRAVLAFAGQVARDAASITEADVDALRQVGLTDNEIGDVVFAAAARCFFADGGRRLRRRRRTTSSASSSSPRCATPSSSAARSPRADRGGGRRPLLPGRARQDPPRGVRVPRRRLRAGDPRPPGAGPGAGRAGARGRVRERPAHQAPHRRRPPRDRHRRLTRHARHRPHLRTRTRSSTACSRSPTTRCRRSMPSCRPATPCSYIDTQARLEAALVACARALRPGGVLAARPRGPVDPRRADGPAARRRGWGTTGRCSWSA